MMNRKSLVLLLLCAGSLSLAAQGWKPPAEGKAVVYFSRISKFQHYASFVLFDGDRFIADFPGQSYFRYECEPGRHVFWLSAENKDFITADLTPGGSYVVLVDTKAGQSMPRGYLVPMIGRHKDFHSVKWGITHHPPVTESAEHIEEENARMAAFIRRSFAEFEQMPEDEKEKLKHLSPDMTMPIEKF